jgi:methionyl-tRNA formyltransferase
MTDVQHHGIVVLGRHGLPMTAHVVQSLITRELQIAAVIFDAKPSTDKDKRIWNERTDGRIVHFDVDFKRHGIETIDVESHNDAGTASLIRHLGTKLLVNGGSPRILKSAILEAPTIGALNVHPGLLPQFRGATCVEWAIYLDEPIGNTVHFMTQGIDEGPIVAQEQIPVKTGDSYIDVRVAIYLGGFDLLGRAARQVIVEDIRPEKLSRQGEGRYFRPIDQDKMADVLRKLLHGQYRPKTS